MRKTIVVSVTVLFMIASFGLANAARDYINIVGSSTVYPFATVVAEQFGKSTSYKTPKIESTGSGGGMKLFCTGVGVEHPDITNASRRIKKSELDNCNANGVEVVEDDVGGGIVSFTDEIPLDTYCSIAAQFNLMNVFDLLSTQTCVMDKPLHIEKYHYGNLCVRGSSAWREQANFVTSEGKGRATNYSLA